MIMAAMPEQSQALGYYSLKLFHDIHSTAPADLPQLDEALPGFPSRYCGERAWEGTDMVAKQDEWIVVLTDQDKAHIVQALRHFQGRYLRFQCCARETDRGRLHPSRFEPEARCTESGDLSSSRRARKKAENVDSWLL